MKQIDSCLIFFCLKQNIANIEQLLVGIFVWNNFYETDPDTYLLGTNHIFNFPNNLFQKNIETNFVSQHLFQAFVSIHFFWQKCFQAIRFLNNFVQAKLIYCWPLELQLVRCA